MTRYWPSVFSTTSRYSKFFLIEVLKCSAKIFEHLRMRNWFHFFLLCFLFLSFRVLSSVLTRSCLYGGWGSRGGGPRSGCWWSIDGAPGPAAGSHGGAHCWCLSLLLGLEGLSTDVMVLLPVLMLAK